MGRPEVSVVIPTMDEGANVLDTIDSVRRNSGGVTLEVVVVDDGSTDASAAALRRLEDRGAIRLVRTGRIGPARARNLGAEVATAPLVAFLDAHCYVPPGWLPPLIALFDRHADAGIVGPAITHTGDLRLVGFGGTWEDASLDMRWLSRPAGPVAVPFQPAGCQLVRRDTFEEIGGFDKGLRRWGSEDVEFCLRAWLMGYENRVHPDVVIAHVFRSGAFHRLDIGQIVYNRMRLIHLHFDGSQRDDLLAIPYPANAMRAARARLKHDDTAARAADLRARRTRDMGWFCERFALLDAA